LQALQVDRISWVVNPPSDDLAAVSLSEYFNRGPRNWYQSVSHLSSSGSHRCQGVLVVESVFPGSVAAKHEELDYVRN
jgi:hypothetical protein